MLIVTKVLHFNTSLYFVQMKESRKSRPASIFLFNIGNRRESAPAVIKAEKPSDFRDVMLK